MNLKHRAILAKNPDYPKRLNTNDAHFFTCVNFSYRFLIQSVIIIFMQEIADIDQRPAMGDDCTVSAAATCGKISQLFVRP